MHSRQPTSPTRRVLVVANETATSDRLFDVVRSQVHGLEPTEVLVVAPALNSRLRHWLSDEDVARKAAARRLRLCVERLAAAGLDAEGVVGDADPLQAIADALRIFPAERLVVATHPEGRSNWLARSLLERVEERFGLPVTHVVVDGDAAADPGRGRPADAYLAA